MRSLGPGRGCLGDSTWSIYAGWQTADRTTYMHGPFFDVYRPEYRGRDHVVFYLYAFIMCHAFGINTLLRRAKKINLS